MYSAAMTVAIYQKMLHREFTREKNTYARKWGEGVCSKGVYCRGLTVATQVQNCMPSL